MGTHCRSGRINLKALVILVLAIVVLLGAAAGAYKIRKRIIADRALAAGKAALQQQNWTEACKQLRQYLSRYPDNPDMLARYAEANLAVHPQTAENIVAAIGAYRRYLRLRPGDEKACHQLADLYLKIGDLQEASHISRQRLEADPDDVQAKLSLSRSLVGLGKAEEAKSQWLEPLVKAHPDQVDAYLLLGEIARQDRSVGPEGVLVWLDSAVANNAKSAKALLSRAAFRQGQISESAAATNPATSFAKTRDEAILADLDAADALKPKDPRLLRLAFDIWMARGRLDRAGAELRAMEALNDQDVKVSGVDPDFAKLLRFGAAGRLALRRQDTKAGIDVADRACKELSASQRLSFLQTAVELYLAGDDLAKARGALDELRKGLEPRMSENPGLAEGLTILEAAVAIKDPNANPFTAISRLRDIVTAEPDQARAWKLLGDAYLRTGQRLRAIRALEQRVRLVPDDHASALSLAKAYLPLEPQRAAVFAGMAARSKQGDLESAVVRAAALIEASGSYAASTDRKQISKELDELRRLHPASAEVRVLIAKLVFAEGDTDKGLAALREAVDQCDDKALAAVELAGAEQTNGDTDAALATARKAVKFGEDLAFPTLCLAQVQQAAKQADAARKTLEQAAAQLKGQERLQAAVSLGAFLLNHDARPEAIALYRRLVSEHPYDVQIRLALLALPEVQSDPAAAQAMVDGLRKIEGATGLLWPVEQARLWLAEGAGVKHQQDIVDLLTGVIDAGAAGPEPVLMLGALYRSCGDSQKAEDLYRQSLNSRPIFIAVVHQLLTLLEQQGRFAEASNVLERLPKDIAALSRHRVTVGVGLGDYKGAIEEVRQRLSVDPQDAASRITLARLVYVQNKDVKAAMALLDEAARIDPNLPELLSTRVAILRADGRSKEALALLDREVARRHDFFTYQLRAGFYEADKQFELAGQDYRHLCTFKDASARGYEVLARFYGRRDQVDQAIAACRQGLKESPGDIGLQRTLAAALVTRSDPNDRQHGRRMVDDLLQKVPNDGALLLVKAQMLLQDADSASRDKAVTALEHAVRVEPRNVRAHLLLINLAHKAGDGALASQRIVRASGANPGNKDILFAEAQLNADQGNDTIAREIAEKIVAQDAKYAPALSLLVRLNLRAGDVAAAQRYNSGVLDESPNDESACLAQARILMAEGQAEQALAKVEAYRKTPAGSRSVNACLTLAQLHQQVKQFEQAGQVLDEAERLAPLDRAVLAARLEWFAAQNRFDDLARLATSPPAGTPDIAAYREMAAMMLASTGDIKCIKEGVKLCQMAVKSDPQRPAGYLKLGQMAFSAGELAEAEQAYRKALELSPDDQQALNDLAWILGTAAGKPKEAIKLAERGVSRYPSDPHLRDTRAAILVRLGRLDEARADLRQCLSLTQEIPATRISALRQLAQILARQGRSDEARQRYTEALKVDEKNKVLARAERAALQAAIQSLPQ